MLPTLIKLLFLIHYVTSDVNQTVLVEYDSVPAIRCSNDPHQKVRVFSSLRSYSMNNYSSAAKIDLHLEQLTVNNKDIKGNEHLALQYLGCLKHLDLQENNLTEVSGTYLHYVPKLVSLNMSHNYISKIEDGTFRDLKELISLDLSFNLIEDIGKYAFLNVMELLYLNLSNNKLTRFDPDSFSNFMSLQVLILRDNDIFHTNYVEWRNLDHLRVLDFSNNLLKSFDFSRVKCLRQLEELNLERNQLRYIDVEGIKNNFPSLHKIDINYNAMNCYPLKVQLPGLRTMNITYSGKEFVQENVEGVSCNRDINLFHVINWEMHFDQEGITVIGKLKMTPKGDEAIAIIYLEN